MNPESLTDQAAHWAARLDAGSLNSREAEALTQWLDADPANEKRLEEMQLLQRKVRLVLPGMIADGRLEVKKKQRSRRATWIWATGLAAALALVVVIFIQRPATFSTAAAQRQLITLEDGSQVELNACTTVRVKMRRTERRVTLEKGEALFTVAKNPARPFTVETEAGRVRVTGTVFNVSNHTLDTLAVVLLEGSVEATPVKDGAPRQLVPGDSLVMNLNGAGEIRRLTPGELADAVAWREGKIVFRDTPLAEALTQFARHHAKVIEASPTARDLTLGGRFALDDLEGFLRDLAVALPVTIGHQSDGSIRVGRIQSGEK